MRNKIIAVIVWLGVIAAGSIVATRFSTYSEPVYMTGFITGALSIPFCHWAFYEEDNKNS
jgi:hypothetical protein